MFISHFLLVLVMIGGLSIYNFQNSMDTIIKTTITSREHSVAALVSHVTDAVHGNNYANLLLPALKTQLKMQDELNYLYVSGQSSTSQRRMEIVYSREIGEVWRSHYPPNFESTLQQRLNRLGSVKESNLSTPAKVDYLINRLTDAKARYRQSLELNQKYVKDLTPCRMENKSHIDFDKGVMYIKVPLLDDVSGTVEILYGIEQIEKIKQAFILDLFKEIVISLAISYPLLLTLSYRLSSPIKRLSNFMKQNFEAISLLQVPESHRTDEIGELAKSFSQLVDKVTDKNKRLNELTKHDPLTGLLNRRSLDSSFRLLSYQAQEAYITCFYIDIDLFKAYNDYYGHLSGDEALKSVSHVLNMMADIHQGYAFRMGGEEFVLMVNLATQEESEVLGERLRTEVKRLNIKHAPLTRSHVLSISIGIAYCSTQDAEFIEPRSLLNKADAALYQAKKLGRDRVILHSKKQRGSA
ncbi:diguanylate cyclase domain-containing protein [Vibrio sp. WZ-1]|uniref:GGDEF domain-containing protein n=1 Tax=Vibrio sp. WZ-1 TaxID=3454501 RepID=UPI003F8729B3